MGEQIPYLPSCVSIPMEEEELKDIVVKAKDWVLLHGIGMRLRTNYSEDCIYHTPFVLVPSTFPRTEFAKALEIQTILNELMHRVAHNNEFLAETLKETIQVDEFTGNLYKIYETVQEEGINQEKSIPAFEKMFMINKDSKHNETITSRTNILPDIELHTMFPSFDFKTCVFGKNNKTNFDKSDIMLETCAIPDENVNAAQAMSYNIKQVEINTIASGFGWLGPASALIHRYVLEELGYYDKLVNIPENNALAGLCQGMLDAWKIYGNPDAAILFIIEDVTYNICDQRFHEFQIRKMEPRARVIRKNLTQVGDVGKLNSDNELVINGHVISVVYFRAGYEPGQYHSKKEWDARLLMERSLAIKCPSIQYHLAGTKKVQEALSKSGVLEMFVTDPKKIESIREIFTGLYGLDFNEAGDQAVQMALNDPERFVLKPQREGGGNNIYGMEIRDAIMQMKDTKERSAWILMERIKPPISKGYIVRPGGPNPPPLVEMVSELGIFGVTIGDSTKIFINRQVGHMLRTKVATANEGGVAAGVGALDSPYLID